MPSPESVKAKPARAGSDPRIEQLGGLLRSHTDISEPERDVPRSPSPDPTAASRRLVFDELAGTADLIESLAICLKEAAGAPTGSASMATSPTSSGAPPTRAAHMAASRPSQNSGGRQ